MFGPNTNFKDSVNICSSHRDQSFFKLFDQVRELFALKFGLEDYSLSGQLMRTCIYFKS